MKRRMWRDFLYIETYYASTDVLLNLVIVGDGGGEVTLGKDCS